MSRLSSTSSTRGLPDLAKPARSARPQPPGLHGLPCRQPHVRQPAQGFLHKCFSRRSGNYLLRFRPDALFRQMLAAIRQRYREGCSFPHLALHADFAAMHRQQFMDKSQPDAAAFMRTAAGVLHTAKSFKQMAKLVLRECLSPYRCTRERNMVRLCLPARVQWSHEMWTSMRWRSGSVRSFPTFPGRYRPAAATARIPRCKFSPAFSIADRKMLASSNVYSAQSLWVDSSL